MTKLTAVITKECPNLVNLEINRGLTGPVFETGYKVAEEKGLALVWMSVGNSYFNRDKIFQIADFVKDRFASVKFLTPAEPAFFTYKGIGYNEGKAMSKARLGSNRLSHHIAEAIKNYQDIKIVNWKDEVSNNSYYLKELEEISNLYMQSKNFWQDANKTTLNVLEGKLKSTTTLNQGVKIGINYLLEELAFVLASPDIYGVPRTAYIYHKRWQIFEKLVNGDYDGIIKEKNGFLLVN